LVGFLAGLGSESLLESEDEESDEEVSDGSLM
jgi:hypothetical protein